MINKRFYTNVELYKRGLYEFISYKDVETGEIVTLHPKQVKALKYFNDNETTYVGFGGAARGGKSVLISLASIMESWAYPKTRYLVGRKNLTMLWQTTWKTLIRMLDNFGFVADVDYVYNGSKHELTFIKTESMIMAKNLELAPSDPEATAYGSLEITKAFIDQSEHVNLKIVEKVGERVGTHFNSKYNLKGKLMECFNPSKTHVNRRYWIPFKIGKEKVTRKFVRSLPTDNPGEEARRWVAEKEIEFKDGTMSNSEYQKQVKGDFDFDDDPTALCKLEDINAIFKNNHVVSGNHYLTADVARLGSDKAVIFVWSGWKVIAKKVFDLSLLTEIQQAINLFRYKYQIPTHYCIADQDGLGSGVVDNCGIIGFVNGATPFPEMTGYEFKKPQYNNLQSQCGYHLANKINKHQLYVDAEVFSDNEMDEMIEELGQLKTFKIDADGKKQLLPKIKIKENIGRSPDYRDTFLMRSYFDLYNRDADFEVEIND